MENKDFEFIIASPIELEKLVCEIYYKNEMIAEISQESDELIIEIFPSQKNKWWKIPFLQFQKKLEEAKNHLLNH